MSVTSFIPALWASTLLRDMEKSLVYGQSNIINRDYQGEISAKGDRVKINSIGAVTIDDYDGTDIGAPETLTTTATDLVIDQANYFNFQVDDVDKAQAAGDLVASGMAEAAYGLRDKVDQYVAAMYGDITVRSGLGTEGTPLDIASGSDAYEGVLLPLSVALSEANTPKVGRFVVIPSWLEARLLTDDRFVKYEAADQTAARLNGAIGRIAGFDVYTSENVPATSGREGAKVIAGVKEAWSLAVQIPESSVEAYRPEQRFADAVKGLSLYGAKVTRPDNLAVAIVSEA